MPEFESITDAVIDAVKALGGSKFVGPMLWPEKTPEAAQRNLLACLNEHRPERLTPEQLLFVARKAKDKGNHSIIKQLAADLGYSEPVPVEPEDEKAELMRQFNASVEAVAKIAQRLESFGVPLLKKVA